MTRNYVGLKANDMGFNAHLTVYFFGEAVAPETVEQWLEEYLLKGTPYAYYFARAGIEFYGPSHARRVPGVKLHSADLSLYNLKIALEEEFGIYSRFKWNPHVTLKFNHTDTIHIPDVIKFTDLGVY